MTGHSKIPIGNEGMNGVGPHNKQPPSLYPCPAHRKSLRILIPHPAEPDVPTPSWLTWKKVTAFCAIPGERTLLDSPFDDGCIIQFLSLGTLSVSRSHDSYMAMLVTIKVCSFDSLVSDTFRLCDLEQAGMVSRVAIPYYVHSEIFHSEISDILHTCTFSDLKT